MNKNKYEITFKDSKEVIEKFIINFKSDKYIAKGFYGKFSNGIIKGYFDNWIIRSEYPPSATMAVKGKYDLEKGELSFKLLNTNVIKLSYLFLFIFNLIFIINIVTVIFSDYTFTFEIIFAIIFMNSVMLFNVFRHLFVKKKIIQICYNLYDKAKLQ